LGATLIGFPARDEIFYIALGLAVLASLAGMILGYRLKKHDRVLHGAVDSSVAGWWPFWVFNFLSPTKWRVLPSTLRPLAIVVMTALGLSVVLLAFIAYRFVASGGSV